ncbi:peptidoglycan DD-metalloendopeptidase family protein [Micromonospora sp. CB01531]|uniref:peptidoglycan DD-metalloendopeptidase family protein n=1 Tax=Micromonospora sp. CB01531 TaxID=1718947 RepID=UPI00093D802C|nr:peptidoglycan DD-metalloendopeptidase family protein [Micromonospora sp. CB01531]OKI56045.1 peptidase M23 [Micromonospora sp. CB01531]
MPRLRIALGVAAASLLGASILTTSPTAAQAAPSTEVTTAVTAKLLQQASLKAEPALRAADASDTRVNITRRAGQRWAFGTAVVVAPKQEGAYPAGWLFVARAQDRGWQIAFDGEPAFADLAAAAPAAVVSDREKQVFTAVTPMYAGGDYRTGMRLPYGVGQSWYLTGGPHGWGGSESPWSAIDLAGGDQRVLAARGGTAYTMCRGWIRVIHDRGYATDYYHLWNSINVNGAGVGEGAYLGDTGTDVTCGGAASGRHVHFALRQNNAYVPMHGHNLGKWVIIPGGATYQGYALHGSAQVNVGGALYNYGALGFTQGVVDANGGGSVNKRTGPGTGYAIAGSVGDGATVSIACSANGTTHTGRWGTTSLWNKLTDGTWVTDAYLWTGSSGAVNGYC